MNDFDMSDLTAPPRDMLVEVTNRCNHKCIFCAHHVMENEQGEIDPSLLRRIFCEAYKMGVRRVGLYTTGEMFLCKELNTHIRNAKEIGYDYIYTDTNGVLATVENLTDVIKAGIHSIKFSINAGKRETYKIVHGRDDFDRVIENLRNCYRLKKELNNSLKIMVSCVATRYTESEIELLRRIVEPYVDGFIVNPLRALWQQMDYDLTYLKPEKMTENVIEIPCSMVMNRIHVTFNGFLSACCIDYNHDVLLADLKKTPLSEAWVSENAVNFRRKHISRQLDGTMCNCCLMNTFVPYEPLIVE